MTCSIVNRKKKVWLDDDVVASILAAALQFGCPCLFYSSL